MSPTRPFCCNASDAEANAVRDDRTQWLMRYQAWLGCLARCEIDSRFAGKFDASDAVQQTLLEAWKDWDNFRGDSEAQRIVWLRQILAHQLAHLARHYAGTQMRDITCEQAIDRGLTESAQRLGALLPSTDPSSSQHALVNEQQLILTQVLESLPADYRQVIMLRNVEDLPHEEVAKRMNRSVGAVRMLWLRALAALRDAMTANGSAASREPSS